MAVIEVDELYTPTGLIEKAKLTVPSLKEDLWFKSGVYPGFSDCHAHPHVIDAGLEGGPWRNYVEWMLKRKLRVDEKALREDLNACTKLSKLTLMLSLLQGVTLIALTGNFRANLRAVAELRERPRVVATPTIINMNGWDPLDRILPVLSYVETLDTEETFKLGIFCHSLKFTRTMEIVKCYRLAENNGLVFALHLSEGVKELRELAKLLRLPGRTRIIGVHCIEDEDYKSLGVKVVQCLSSNLTLYGRTQKNLELVESFGSDWPLIFGGFFEEIVKALKLHGQKNTYKILEKASIGGYRLYGVEHGNDYIFFDEKLEKALRLKILPSYVFVRGRATVVEGLIGNFNYDSLRKIVETYKEFLLEKYSSEGSSKWRR
ncbi:MAG: hypothetical protein DRJ38_07485 [Thermoprotei archaeon]|nr:MAG: hypothetical protein DRJ38_07485 [Thermoprotei archaeon]